MQVETVKITDKNRRGFKVINKSDFNSKLHTEFGKAAPKKAAPKKSVKKTVKDADSN